MVDAATLVATCLCKVIHLNELITILAFSPTSKVLDTNRE
jgi:hypothetical protein